MKWIVKILFLLLMVMGINNVKAQIKNTLYKTMLSTLYGNTVPLMTCSALKKLDKAILLDAREKKEYKVSHLKDAVWVGYDTYSKKNLPEIQNLHDTIVVYCSVGYRSEKIGEKLIKMGYTNVFNLYGGIFEWVNQGHEVYVDNKKTTNVHAYSKAWGIWLDNGHKVY